MSRFVLFPVLLIAAAGLQSCAESPAALRAPVQLVDVEQVSLDPEEAQRMINTYRAANGLKPLRLDTKLSKAARQHASDLARHDRISHKGSDGSDPWVRVAGAGYKAKLAAENVGVGQRSIAEVIAGWKESPGHNRNLLLKDATEMGIALEKDTGTRYGTFWTLVLGQPL